MRRSCWAIGMLEWQCGSTVPLRSHVAAAPLSHMQSVNVTSHEYMPPFPAHLRPGDLAPVPFKVCEHAGRLVSAGAVQAAPVHPPADVLHCTKVPSNCVHGHTGRVLVQPQVQRACASAWYGTAWSGKCVKDPGSRIKHCVATSGDGVWAGLSVQLVCATAADAASARTSEVH